MFKKCANDFWHTFFIASMGCQVLAGAHIIARYVLQLAWNTCAFQGRSMPSSKFLSHIHHNFFPAFIKVSSPPSSQFLPYFTQNMFFFFKRNLLPTSMGT
jgi:lipoprotein